MGFGVWGVGDGLLLRKYIIKSVMIDNGVLIGSADCGIKWKIEVTKEEFSDAIYSGSSSCSARV